MGIDRVGRADRHGRRARVYAGTLDPAATPFPAPLGDYVVAFALPFDQSKRSKD